MSLLPGSRIGPYEIVSAIGAGGMGEVYRGRDTTLGRDVAIKALPDLFATDAERAARLLREAQILASLNHSNIAGIYGLEDDGRAKFLVLEFIDGVSLADRVASGLLPLEEALAIARQIAEALEAAHDKGIVHRDLKPGNVMLTNNGQAKVLDFGLARTTEAVSPANVMNSPTLTFAATEAGLILGTAAYMAPEQAKGRVVDKRCDIWAFGVLLFEMLAGAHPFGGETISEKIAAIIKDSPPWAALPADLPPALCSLLRRMLEKDPKRRLRDIGDARLVLEDIAAGAESEVVTPERASAARQRWRTAVPWTLAAAATALAALFASRAATRTTAELPSLKYTLPITGESLERFVLPSISPDSRHVVFSKRGTLWLRALDQLEPRQLTGTDGAQFPFWSPDSQQVAYLSGSAMYRVGIDGTPPVRVANATFQKGARTPGGVWRPDGTLIFAPAASGSGLVSVPEQGGEFAEFYRRNAATEGDFHRPALLPDGKSLLFIVDRLDTGSDTIGVLSDGTRKDIFSLKSEVLDSPVYSPTGHVLFHRETSSPGIWALPFDAARLEPTGAPFLVSPQGSYPSISRSGVLMYSESTASGLGNLAWVDVKAGTVSMAFEEPFAGLRQPRLSPNGQKVAAVAYAPGEGYIVIVADLQRQTHVKVGGRASGSSRPAWLDDQTITYARDDGTDQELVTQPADGSGDAAMIARGLSPGVAAGFLVFSRLEPGKGGGLHYMKLQPGGRPGSDQLLQQLPQHEWEPALSPNGTLLAYTQGDVDRSEVILRTFPQQSGRWQVSASGGTYPVWTRRGDALFYRAVGGPIFKVDVQTTPGVVLSTPKAVVRPSSLVARVGYDVSLDGTRLLMVQEARLDDQSTAGVVVAQNWVAPFRK